MIIDNTKEGAKIDNTSFQNELRKNGYNVTVNYDNDNNFLVKFIDTNHTYTIENRNRGISNETLVQFAKSNQDKLDTLVPILTSNTTTNMEGVECGVASESSFWWNSSRKAWAAFNGNITNYSINNCWQATSKASSTGSYIRYHSTTSDTIISVKVGTWDDNSNNTDKTWTTYIRGSNDGINWNKISNDVVLTVSKNNLTYYEYEINDYNKYEYYDLYFDAQDGDAEYVHLSNQYGCNIMYLQFFGLKEKTLLEFYNQNSE